ncbi:serine/threonine-protein kinase [Cyclobacterium sp. 1_MG-2023]|uniref:serine/threonine-protein kinase n=1 Tax=Cyclobacterium sp. 1_MG-2023 TaxID=3062681 RepID=UPI0026E1C23F|nr:serine/threonine-protein kinase [Cyclobacterium sp. 1_MG-2023]MDO6435914.1 serine/threonine-protein kinase [Cyclobacterium sp. 1_MG-2023]
MTSKHVEWEKVENLFHEIADKSEVEKKLLLDSLEYTSPETCFTLKSLLIADNSPNSIFKISPNLLLRTWENNQFLIGKKIGAFKLAEIIGSGAMGTVFKGIRVDGQFEQVVAIKLMNSQVTNSFLKNRFYKERQILAKLNHHGIARLYDGEFNEEGRPYFTMEYVLGHTLIEYCKLNICTITQRLNLFIQISEAIQYAHQLLIVHLDLKPQNILVDSSGTVKLLDFGVARLLVDTNDFKGSYTLAYAAPEQINNLAPSIFTDIYALGIILFELCTQTHPFQLALNDQKLLTHQKLRGDSLPFSMEGIQVSKLMLSDLKFICNKAMALKPEDRYVSISDLMRDIKASQYNHPISIRNKEWKYKAEKYIKRNSKILTSIVVGVLFFFSAVIFYTYQLKMERNLSIREAKRANQITDLMTDVFMAADPNIGGADTITAVNLLNQGLESLEKNLSEDNYLYADMLGRLSPIYYNLGKYEKAQELAFSAYNINNKLPFITQNVLAQNEIEIGKSFFYFGKLDSAVRYLNMAILRLKKNDLSHSKTMAHALTELGNSYYDNRKYQQADSAINEAYNLYKALTTPPNTDLAFSLHMLGAIARKTGDLDKSESYLLEALAMKENLFIPPHLEIAYTYNFLGSLYQSQGEFNKAMKFIRASLDQRKSILGESHVETIASMSNLARTYGFLEQPHEAIPLYEKALTKIDSLFGKTHPYYAGILESLAKVYLKTGAIEKAKASLITTISINQELFPQEDPRQASPVIFLGKIAMQENDFPKAKEYLVKGLRFRQASLPEGDQLIAQSQRDLASCLMALGDFAEAIYYYEAALQTYASASNPSKETIDSIKSELLSAKQNNIK